jgi:hypothetical protein
VQNKSSSDFLSPSSIALTRDVNDISVRKPGSRLISKISKHESILIHFMDFGIFAVGQPALDATVVRRRAVLGRANADGTPWRGQARRKIVHSEDIWDGVD